MTTINQQLDASNEHTIYNRKQMIRRQRKARARNTKHLVNNGSKLHGMNEGRIPRPCGLRVS
jgi:hypothetical protein